MSVFYVIEGATCAGKTTFTRSIQNVYGGHVILEHPPLDKGQAPDLLAYYQHQLNVFGSFRASFDDAPTGTWYVDYSPFGCIPFTKALVDVGAEACAPLIPYMIKECNALCKRHMIYLHRYLPIEYEVGRQRLLHRGRRGDDSWSEDLLRAIYRRYDEFFGGGGLDLTTSNRIKKVNG